MTNTAHIEEYIEGDRLTLAFRMNTVAIKAWPCPGAWQKSVLVSRWLPYRPELSLNRGQFLGLPVGAGKLCQQFLNDRIPEPVREVVGGFPAGNRTSPGQWEMLNLVALIPEALDLARSNPALALMVCELLDTMNPGALRVLLQSPQKVIAASVGLPDTRGAVKLFKKLLPDALHLSHIRALARAYQQGNDLKLFTHVTKINTGVLEILNNERLRACVSVLFLEEVAQKGIEHPSVWINKVLDLAEVLGRPPERSFTSLDELFKMHHRLSEEQHRMQRHMLAQRLEDGTSLVTLRPVGRRRRRRSGQKKKRQTNPMLEPPLEGTNFIRPVSTSAIKLRSWGREQSNCASSRLSRVKRGNYYIYAVLSPWEEEATLAITRQKGQNRWKIAELKAKFNAPPSTRLRSLVKTWLEEQQSGNA